MRRSKLSIMGGLRGPAVGPYPHARFEGLSLSVLSIQGVTKVPLTAYDAVASRHLNYLVTYIFGWSKSAEYDSQRNRHVF